MLQRILSKKKHAVNLSDRHRTRIVTRSKVNAFMRSLDFEGSEAEWAVLGKKEEVNLERMGMRMKLDEEKNESQSQREEKEKRLDRMSPRELRLLAGWGIGPTFWDGMFTTKTERLACASANQILLLPTDVIEDNRPQSRGRSRTRRRSPASDDDYIPTIPDKISSAHASIPPKAQDSNAFAVPAIPRSGVSAGRPLAAGTPAWNTPGAPLFMVPLTPDVTDMGGWGGSFDPTAPTPLAGGCGSAYGGVYSAADLDVRQQPSSYSGWGGAFDTSPQLPVPTPVCGANGGRGYGNASPESLPRETSGQKVDVDKSKQTSGYMSNGHWQ